jgi:hypothetical protein
MFNKKVVHEALRESFALENNPKTGPPENPPEGQDTLISLLIHDVFGGEILKTRMKKGWHFYNRVDGEKVDFSNPENSPSIEDKFEDIPASPDEPCRYVVKEDYTTFFMRFIRAFEEIVGLENYHSDNYRTGYST